MAAAKIPWQKIKELVLAQISQLWDDEEKKMKAVVDDPDSEKQLSMSASVNIDLSGDLAASKTKLSISKGKITSEVSGTVDDPAQMSLGEKPEDGEKKKE